MRSQYNFRRSTSNRRNGLKFMTVVSLLAFLSVTASAEMTYTQHTVVSGLPTHGINGLTFGPDGWLYGSTVMGTGLIRVDVKTGALEKLLADQVSGDDLAFVPDGSLAWTAL